MHKRRYFYPFDFFQNTFEDTFNFWVLRGCSFIRKEFVNDFCDQKIDILFNKL